MSMRLALAPKAVGVEEAEVGEAGVVGGAPGKRHFDIDIVE